MKVKNMTSSRGNTIANQFIITEEGRGANGNFVTKQVFQSYDSVIAIWTIWQDGSHDIVLDEKYWDYSTTTGKYRNQFLGEIKKETQAKIDNGTYKLANLNK
jgi:hypothetical protein